MMRATLILNPRSGKGRAPDVLELARALSRQLGVDLSERMIEGPGHGSELAREAVTAGHDRVIAAGRLSKPVRYGESRFWTERGEGHRDATIHGASAVRPNSGRAN